MTVSRGRHIFATAFGVDEFGLPDIPAAISNVQLARLRYGNLRGCGWCFPHGWETDNAADNKGTRSWKHHRGHRWRGEPERRRLRSP